MSNYERQKLTREYQQELFKLSNKRQRGQISYEDYMASSVVEGMKTHLKMKALEVPHHHSTHYNNAATAIGWLGDEIKIILIDTAHGLTHNQSPQQMWHNMSRHIEDLERQRINDVQRLSSQAQQAAKKVYNALQDVFALR